MNTPVVLILFLSFSSFADIIDDDVKRQPIGESDTDETPMVTTEIPSTTPHLCHCTLISFDSDEMEGTLKNPGYPNNYCDDQQCSYEIEPSLKHATLITVSTMQMEAEYDRLDLFYYGIVEGKREYIFLSNLARRDFIKYVAPKDIGFFINMTSDGSNTGRFLLQFSRISEDDVTGDGSEKKTCPYPFLQATNRLQSFKTNGWLNSGCAFRFISNTSIDILSKCAYKFSTGMYIRATLPGKTNEYWSFSNSESQRKTTSSVDLMIRGSSYFYGGRRSIENCELFYISLNYNPCNCSSTKFILGPNEGANISSPGFPEMYCANMDCTYEITRINASSTAKSGFRISTIHFAHSRSDSLSFFVDNDEINRMSSDKNIQSGIDVIRAESIKIKYSASSKFDNIHGFALQIKAIDIPFECICSSNAPKLLPIVGSYSMSIPSFCPDMFCRMIIPVPSSYAKQNFRMSISYHFPHEEESFEVWQNDMPTRYASEPTTKTYLFTSIVDTPLKLIYRRLGIQNPINDPRGVSQFNLTWKWLNKRDCSCDSTILPAATDNWDEIFSPRYPDDYCLNMFCIYRIQAPVGHHIILNVTFFETEPHSDYLTFFDNFNISTKHSLQLNGHILNVPLFTSNGRNVSLVFKTDGSITAKGFVIAYKAVKDPTDFSEYSGHGIIFFLVLFLVLSILGGVVGYAVYHKKYESFRNPLYIPSIRYSTSEDRPAVDNEIF